MASKPRSTKKTAAQYTIDDVAAWCERRGKAFGISKACARRIGGALRTLSAAVKPEDRVTNPALLLPILPQLGARLVSRGLSQSSVYNYLSHARRGLSCWARWAPCSAETRRILESVHVSVTVQLTEHDRPLNEFATSHGPIFFRLPKKIKAVEVVKFAVHLLTFCMDVDQLDQEKTPLELLNLANAP